MVLPILALLHSVTLLSLGRSANRRGRRDAVESPSTPAVPERPGEPEELTALRTHLAEHPVADGRAQAARAKQVMNSYLDARRRRLRRELDERRQAS